MVKSWLKRLPEQLERKLLYIGSISSKSRIQLNKPLKALLIAVNRNPYLKQDYVKPFSSNIAFPKILLSVPFISFNVKSAVQCYCGKYI